VKFQHRHHYILEKNEEPTFNKLIPSIAIIKETLYTFQKNQTENIDEEAINFLVLNLLISIDYLFISIKSKQIPDGKLSKL